jgi:hypothetical protein
MNRHSLQYPAMLLMACSANRLPWDSAHACAPFVCVCCSTIQMTGQLRVICCIAPRWGATCGEPVPPLTHVNVDSLVIHHDQELSGA